MSLLIVEAKLANRLPVRMTSNPNFRMTSNWIVTLRNEESQRQRQDFYLGEAKNLLD